MAADARVVAAPDGRGGTALPLLHGDGPLALRRLRHEGAEARVCLLGAMSAPLNGDRLRLEVDLGPTTRLRYGTAAATVALPGRTTEPAHYETSARVAEGARLRLLPEPLVSAAGSVLRTVTRVELAATAGLVLREEQVLGRAGEPPGDLSARLTVHRAGEPLYDQHTRYGSERAPGWDGPAGVGGQRAVGQLLLVGDEFDHSTATRLLGRGGSEEGEGVAVPIAEAATLVTALAPDALRLRRLLDALAGARGHQEG
ncbi:urease accessory protein UreD [Streptomyces sp. NPDC005438]|uniref:urease accessory protein UreD n=1 Tax=Streptomyces sp. NPDC005438 TaxID=3156880 RepID=UPI0033BD0E72